ncbi:Sensor protein ChvG [Azospirillaceae bacterium]
MPHVRSAPRRRPSPLTRRILAVNSLALLFLVGGVLYLGRYQDRLIQTEIDALRTEARIFSGALAEGAVRLKEGDDNEPAWELRSELARRMVRRLVETTATRTRLFDRSGRRIADSRELIGVGGAIQIEELLPSAAQSFWSRGSERLYDWIVDSIPLRPQWPVYQEQPLSDLDRFDDSIPESKIISYPDVERALAGENSATIWEAAEGALHRGLVLTVAVPLQQYKQVLGVVFLSRSGQDIESSVRSVRFDILKMFVLSLAVTAMLSVYLAGTIVRPLRRLAQAADRVRHGLDRRHDIPDLTGRNDEIGDLSRALRAMTGALWARMDAIERFAADVAHEIKNPLTSLRSAVETAARVQDDARRRRLMSIIIDDVRRLDRLISDISNASRLDAELSREVLSPVDVGAMLDMLAMLHTETCAVDAPNAPRLVVERPPELDLVIQGLESRLVQVFQNLIANALSFSPPGGVVTISVRAVFPVDKIEIAVADQGPGVPESKLDTIFERFYTERPAGEKFGIHSGLGLSISRQIVEAHDGVLWAENRRAPDQSVCGAVFRVLLPRATEGPHANR